MKISGLTTALNVMNQVRDKKDAGDGGTGQNAYENQFQKRKNDSERREASEEDVQEALREFAADPAAQSGITASAEGSGPGLRIVLRDGSGQALRQMSGDEFVRMRENARGDSRPRGKLLDQKF